ncbi:MAG: hypothetical protein U9Q69_00245 [Nanoarchaeota archaeon]|nr:hypothetical protein [Nanoarchaeota archaeon]
MIMLTKFNIFILNPINYWHLRKNQAYNKESFKYELLTFNGKR